MKQVSKATDGEHSAATSRTASAQERQASQASNSYFASDPSKAYYEKLSLVWAPISMFLLLAGLLGTGLYEHCDRNSYLAVTLVGCLPGFLVPILFPCKADRGRPYAARFWVRASAWIAIFGFYGNYFWTHYFYQLLGAEYLFDSYRINDVPVVCFTATYFYFTFYFSFINVVLRRLRYYTATAPRFLRTTMWWSAICFLSYATAIFEAVTIQHFPLYTYTDRDRFFTVGSVVYGLYFVVGFPMFFAIDENLNSSQPSSMTLWDTVVNACGASAIVTLLLDIWRLVLGNIYDLGSGQTVPLPFVYQSNTASTARTHTSFQTSAFSDGDFDISVYTRVAKDWAQNQANAAKGWTQEAVSQIGTAREWVEGKVPQDLVKEAKDWTQEAVSQLGTAREWVEGKAPQAFMEEVKGWTQEAVSQFDSAKEWVEGKAPQELVKEAKDWTQNRADIAKGWALSRMAKLAHNLRG